MNDYWVHVVLIVLVGYAAHTLLGFALDLHGVRLARAVFPIGSLKFWQRLIRHAAFHSLDAIDAQEIVVRTSLVGKTEGFGESTFRYYTHTAEMLALQQFTAHLSDHNVNLNTEHFYSNEVEKKYLLLLGTDANNRLSQHMLKDLGRDVDWAPTIPPNTDHPPFTLYGIPYQCHDENGKVCVDYGLIVRRTRPNDGVTLLCAGIHAYGTYAACRIALREDFQRFVRSRKATSFAQLVKVVVIDGKEINDAEITWHEKDFIVVNPLK